MWWSTSTLLVDGGVVYLLAVSIILIYPRIRQVELELSDAIPAEYEVEV